MLSGTISPTGLAPLSSASIEFPEVELILRIALVAGAVLIAITLLHLARREARSARPRAATTAAAQSPAATAEAAAQPLRRAAARPDAGEAAVEPLSEAQLRSA